MTAAEQPSGFARGLTRFVVGLSALLMVLGIYWYGWSLEVHHRFWSDIADRIHGPMTSRFLLQPASAFIAALTDGIHDVRRGHKSFFWTVQHDPAQQGGRLREGLISTARVALIGISLDLIYQFWVSDHFYPAEAVMMALLLAVIPYFILRWIVEFITRWWLGRA